MVALQYKYSTDLSNYHKTKDLKTHFLVHEKSYRDFWQRSRPILHADIFSITDPRPLKKLVQPQVKVYFAVYLPCHEKKSS